jgi:hypothetical protein
MKPIVLIYRVRLPDGTALDHDGEPGQYPLIADTRYAIDMVSSADANASGDPYNPAPVRTIVYSLRRLKPGEVAMFASKPTPHPAASSARYRAGQMFGGAYTVLDGGDEDVIVLVRHGVDIARVGEVVAGGVK